MKRQKRTTKEIRGFAATRDPRGLIKQAEKDLQRGVKDTDCRGVGKDAACPPGRASRKS